VKTDYGTEIRGLGPELARRAIKEEVKKKKSNGLNISSEYAVR
jgi:hypothetical protein